MAGGHIRPCPALWQWGPADLADLPGRAPCGPDYIDQRAPSDFSRVHYRLELRVQVPRPLLSGLLLPVLEVLSGIKGGWLPQNGLDCLRARSGSITTATKGHGFVPGCFCSG